MENITFKGGGGGEGSKGSNKKIKKISRFATCRFSFKNLYLKKGKVGGEVNIFL